MRATSLITALGLIAGTGLAQAATTDSSYGRNLISVATISRHSDFPSANCMVWANAEGLGVGPAQLGGYHGLTMNINPKPLAVESGKATTFEDGFAEMKARYPTAPAWLLKTVEKNRNAILLACEQDHGTPFTVHRISAADAHG